MNSIQSTAWRDFMSKGTPYFFLLPAFIIVTVALIVPVFNSISLSFFDLQFGQTMEEARFIGLEGYQRLFSNPRTWSSLLTTMIFVAAIVIGELTLGIALALLLEKPIAGMSVFRTLFILPMMIAPIAVGLLWKYLFDGRLGLINHFIGKLGFEPIQWLADPAFALPAVIFTDIWQWTPFIFIIVIAGLQGISSSVIEAAKIDGASAWQTIFKIKLPLMMPIITVAFLLRLIDAFKVLEVIFIMTQGGPGQSTMVLAMNIYQTAFTAGQLGDASVLATVLLVIVTIITFIMMRVTRLKDMEA